MHMADGLVFVPIRPLCEYLGMGGELYHRYGITSYKSLPAHRFEDAVNFLTQWQQEIVTDTAF